MASAGLAVAREQQRAVEIDPIGVLGEQQRRRGGERGRHHRADHDLEARAPARPRAMASASVRPPVLSSLMLTAS